MRKLSSLQSALDRFYKLRQLFYYKVRHGLLQIATVQRLSGKAENSCTLYKFHEGRKGPRPMGSNADRVLQS